MRLIKSNIVLVSVCCLIFISCNTTRTDFIGEFKGDDVYNRTLKFDNKSFTYIDHVIRYNTFDTLALGNWKYSDGLISLYSNDTIINSILSLEIKEYKEDIGDSIRLSINNLVEQHSLFNNIRNLNYRILIKSNSVDFDNRVKELVFDTPVIFISKPEGVTIYGFLVVVLPTEHLIVKNNAGKSIVSEFYEVKSVETNCYSVDIPSLNFSFFEQLRLNEDYVRVINKRKLEWNGVKYKRSN